MADSLHAQKFTESSSNSTHRMNTTLSIHIPSLLSILSSLTTLAPPGISQINYLTSLLHPLLISDHLYHSQWEQLENQPQLFDTILHIIIKYEANGLQLHGDGVHLLQRLLSHGNYSFSSSMKFSINQILEILLRILLEHPIYLICLEILWKEMKKDETIFRKLCSIAIRIADELPNPLLCENFAAFANFLTESVRNNNWSLPSAHLALHALSVIAPIVESFNVRYDFHYKKLLDLCSHFQNGISPPESSTSSSSSPRSSFSFAPTPLPAEGESFPELRSPLVTFFSFLKEICPLHPQWIPSLLSRGFIQYAIDLLLSVTSQPSSTLAPIPLDQPILTSLFQFLTVSCWSDDVLLLVMSQISRMHLQEILNYCWFENSSPSQSQRHPSFDTDSNTSCLQIRRNIMSVSSFVDFVSVTYGSLFIPLQHPTAPLNTAAAAAASASAAAASVSPSITSPPVNPDTNLILLMETYFLYSIETLKLHSLTYSSDEQWNENIISILTGIRHFGRGRLHSLLLSPPPSSSSFSSSVMIEYKYQVIHLVKYYLPSFDETLTELSALHVLAIDIYSLLNGWIDECWRNLIHTDEEMMNFLHSIHQTYEIQRKHSRAILSTIMFNNNPETMITSSSPSSSLSLSLEEELLMSGGGGGGGAGGFNFPTGSSSSNNNNSPHIHSRPYHHTSASVSSSSSINNDGVSVDSKYPLLPFFLNELHGSSIGETLPKILEHFVNEWETNSHLEVYHKIVIIVGIFRTSESCSDPRPMTPRPMTPMTMGVGDRGMGQTDAAADHLRGTSPSPGETPSHYFLQVSEILIELLTDERHQVHEFNGMQEKCLQLLFDVISRDRSCIPVAAHAMDLILELLSSVQISSNPFLIYTCLSILSLIASHHSQSDKLLLNSIDKFDQIIHRCGSLSLLIAIMNLYQQIQHLFPKFSTDHERIFIRWVVTCIQSKVISIRCYGYQYLSSLSQLSSNRQLIFRGFSRVEVEHPLIREILEAKVVGTGTGSGGTGSGGSGGRIELYSLLLSLKALSCLAMNYNDTPQWYLDSWILPSWTANRKENRQLMSVGILHEFYQLLMKFKSPENKLILGYLLLIFTSLVEIQLRAGCEEYGLKFFSIYMSELSYLLALITSQHRYVSTYDMHRQRHQQRQSPMSTPQDQQLLPSAPRDSPSQSSSGEIKLSDREDTVDVMSLGVRELYEPLVNTPLHPINPSYEFLSSCAIQTIHTLILFDHSHDTLFLFYQYEILFQETPLPEAVVYLMLQYPHHPLIQTKGIFIIQKFLENQLSIPMMSACFERVLCQLMEGQGEDGTIHSSFCKILLSLASVEPEDTDTESNEGKGKEGSPEGQSKSKRRGRRSWNRRGKSGNEEDPASGGGLTGNNDNSSGSSKDLGEMNRRIILNSPLLKWLAVIIRYGSPENGPLACQVIATLALQDLETCHKPAVVEMCPLMIQLLEKHTSVLRVQIEGVKALSLLGQKSMKCLKQIRGARGERVIENSRQFLREVVVACDEGFDQLEHSCYSKEDVLETINLSNPKRFMALCVLS
jgi:hypothetical protein